MSNAKFKAAPFKKLIRELERELATPTEGFHFNMTDYGSRSACGTQACAMGTGVLRGVFPGVKPIWGEVAGQKFLKNHFVSIGEAAFGIDYTEYNDLFSSHGAEGRDLPQQIAYMKRFLARKQAVRP